MPFIFLLRRAVHRRAKCLADPGAQPFLFVATHFDQHAAEQKKAEPEADDLMGIPDLVTVAKGCTSCGVKFGRIKPRLYNLPGWRLLCCWRRRLAGSSIDLEEGGSQ